MTLPVSSGNTWSAFFRAFPFQRCCMWGVIPQFVGWQHHLEPRTGLGCCRWPWTDPKTIARIETHAAKNSASEAVFAVCSPLCVVDVDCGSPNLSVSDEAASAAVAAVVDPAQIARNNSCAWPTECRAGFVSSPALAKPALSVKALRIVPAGAASIIDALAPATPSPAARTSGAGADNSICLYASWSQNSRLPVGEVMSVKQAFVAVVLCDNL